MDITHIHRFFSFNRILKLVIGLSVVVQLAVISYNHFSGYYLLSGFPHFLIRMLRGTIMSMLAGFLIVYPDLFLIRHLNRFAPWNEKTIRRIGIQTGFVILTAWVVSTLVTTLFHLIRPYKEEIGGVLLNNALIYTVVNILVMAILEGWIFYSENRHSEQIARELKAELSQIKFEVLKSQINPHFMFNSLNVLSGLINKDVAKAQQFIDEFSHIYRYVLETIEQPVTTLEKELDFMKSYLFLQQIRYGVNLTYAVNIPATLLGRVMPPLSLQIVLENAMKHNIINEAKPLRIEIYYEGEMLIVKNNLQPKATMGNSTGLGLKNLAKRYVLIHDQIPSFTVETNYYLARLPLIDIEKDERADH